MIQSRTGDCYDLFQKADLLLGKKPPFLGCTTALLIVGKIMQTTGDHSNLLASNIYCKFCYVQFGVCTDTKTKGKKSAMSLMHYYKITWPVTFVHFFFLVCNK